MHCKARRSAFASSNDSRSTTHDPRLFRHSLVAIACANAREKAAFFVGQGLQAFTLDLFEQHVHASFFPLAFGKFAAQAFGGALL